MAVKEVKAVLVGCGSMANAWMSVIQKVPGLKIVGLTDMRRPAAEAMAVKYGLDPAVVFDTQAQAMAKTRPDAVFDVTVPAAHHDVTIAALKAGCHVMGEKPLADTLPRARRMIAAAHKAKRLYAVIQNRRYEPNIQRVRKVLRGGAIGLVDELHADFYIGAHFGGFRDVMDHPLILDMAIHTFDAARYVIDADPVAAYCHAFNPGRSWYKGAASAVVIFEMIGPRKNSIVFSYRGSWCAEGLNTSWNSTWHVIGRKGTLVWNGDAEIKAAALKRGGKPGFFSEMEDVAIPDVKVEHLAHDGLIREFVDCVRSGKKPQTICDDNVKSLAMVLAAVESAEAGKRVKVKW